MSRLFTRLTFALFTVALALVAPSAHAEPVSPELMAKFAAYADAWKAQLRRASYHVEGKMEILDSDGDLKETMEGAAQVDAQGDAPPKVTVLRYSEDGKDKLEEAKKDQKEGDERRRKKREQGKELKMPIVASVQGRYNFDQTEVSADGKRVKIVFTPKEPADDTVEGSAWADAEAGTVISASFKPSKTSMFVRYVHFTVEFGATTSLGPAVSKVTWDGEGGILFFSRRFRGFAVLSNYAIAP
jgi:hypothetical protein